MTNNVQLGKNAKCENSKFGLDCIIYRDAEVINSQIQDRVTIGDNSNIVSCHFGSNIAINRRCYINNSIIGDYSYVGLNCVINYTQIGKFCSIARGVDIGGFNHDYTKVKTMPEFRFKQLFETQERVNTNLNEEEGLCKIGNDVWIAAGAHILHSVTIGDGAVIGAGAVVTKDVEPYSIVTGIPAKTYKKRFEQKYIDKLLKIQWWNLPKNIIEQNINIFLQHTVNDETIELLERMSEEYSRD